MDKDQRWVLLPIVICLAAPIYFSNWISLVPAVASSIGAYLIVRKDSWQLSTKTSLCVVMIALTYGVSGGIIGGFAVQDGTESSQANILDDEEKKRKIFAMAMRYTTAIQEGKDDLARVRQQGGNVSFYEKRLAMREENHVSQQEFTQQFYRITPEQLKRIVNEGIAERWPVPE